MLLDRLIEKPLPRRLHNCAGCFTTTASIAMNRRWRDLYDNLHGKFPCLAGESPQRRREKKKWNSGGEKVRIKAYSRVQREEELRSRTLSISSVDCVKRGWNGEQEGKERKERRKKEGGGEGGRTTVGNSRDIPVKITSGSSCRGYKTFLRRSRGTKPRLLTLYFLRYFQQAYAFASPPRPSCSLIRNYTDRAFFLFFLSTISSSESRFRFTSRGRLP